MRFRDRFLSLLLAGLALAALAGLAGAHAGLVTAEPKPKTSVWSSPESLRLVFSEQLLPGSTLQLLDPALQPVPGVTPVLNGAEMLAAVPRPLAQGRYTVVWKTVSPDGELEGRYTFQVGPPPAVLGLGALAALALAAAEIIRWRRRSRK